MNKFGNSKNNRNSVNGMLGMLKYLNIPHEGRHHSGIDDVRNICNIVIKLLEHGVHFDYTTFNFNKRSIYTDYNVQHTKHTSSKWQTINIKNNNNNKNNNNLSQLNEFILKLRGLPFSSTHQHIKEFFGALCPLKSIHLTRDTFGRLSGEAFIELNDEKDLKSALTKHRAHMGPRYIEIFPSSKQELINVLTSSDPYNYKLSFNTRTKHKFRYLVVLDFEATCNEPHNPEPQEIIEWPAMIIDTKTNEILDKIFHYYIQPTIHKKLPEFCTKLTGITQKLLHEKGGDPPHTINDIVQLWNKWCLTNNLLSSSTDKPSACIVTHLDWDLQSMWTMQQNTSKCSELAVLFHSWINIVIPIEHNLNKFNSSKRFGRGLKRILNYLNIPLEGRHHSGIDDVKNICKIVQKCIKKGIIFGDYTTTNYGKRNIQNDVEYFNKYKQIDAKMNENDNQKENINIIKNKFNVSDVCILFGLQKMKSMNGKVCKITGAFNEKEQRYPVLVFETNDIGLIKPENLKLKTK